MQIRFSRHAKRRIKSYNIFQSIVQKILKGKELIEGNQVIVENVKGLKYPLKIIIAVGHEIVTGYNNVSFKKGDKK